MVELNCTIFGLIISLFFIAIQCCTLVLIEIAKGKKPYGLIELHGAHKCKKKINLCNESGT